MTCTKYCWILLNLAGVQPECAVVLTSSSNLPCPSIAVNVECLEVVVLWIEAPCHRGGKYLIHHLPSYFIQCENTGAERQGCSSLKSVKVHA
jgi:hypothetical protein